MNKMKDFDDKEKTLGRVTTIWLDDTWATPMNDSIWDHAIMGYKNNLGDLNNTGTVLNNS